jgi:arylsulfatase A-like enzyme
VTRAVLCTLWALLLAPPIAAEPANVLLVLADDMRRDDLAYMPHVQELLVERGASFSAYVANVAVCCPSRATVLRGQYSHNTGIFTNQSQGGGFAKVFRTGLEKATVATALHDAGYTTGYFGKYLNGYPGEAGIYYVPPGWDTWQVPVLGDPHRGYDYHLLEEVVPGYLAPVRYGDTPADYVMDVLAARVRSFVQDAVAAERPFFAFVAPYAPHIPAVAAPRHRGLFANLAVPRDASYGELDVADKPSFIRRLRPLGQRTQKKLDDLYRRRVRSLQAVDEAIASFVTLLDALGARESTYVLLSSDNGFHLGEHRLGWGKHTAYDEDILLPLVVTGPGVPEGVTIPALSGNTDLAPTFAEIAGTQLAYEPDGRSLLPWLAGASQVEPWRQAFLVNLWRRTRREDRDPRTRVPPFVGIRTPRYLYVEYASEEIELYDVAVDPEQLDNLAGVARIAQRSLLSGLAGKLAKLRGCRGRQCRDLEDAPIPASRTRLGR